MKRLTSKILLLGAQGVGKTTLALKIASAELDAENVGPTIGVSYVETRVEVGDHVVTLQLWDTAGQERFKAMIPMYYRNSSGALLIYDVMDANSFLAVQEWEAELRAHGDENLVIFVIGNKYDSSMTTRKVNQSEASAFAEGIGAHFREVSALSDSGVSQLKLDLCVQLIHNIQRTRMSVSSYEEMVGDPASVLLRKRSSSAKSLALSPKQCCF